MVTPVGVSNKLFTDGEDDGIEVGHVGTTDGDKVGLVGCRVGTAVGLNEVGI